MDINEAHATVKAALDDLNAAAKAKGMKRGIYILVNESYTSVSTSDDIPGLFCHSLPLGEMIAQAHDAIEKLHDPHAYDAELSAPLFLMSEQQQAAE